jgi:hypothetical protein
MILSTSVSRSWQVRFYGIKTCLAQTTYTTDPGYNSQSNAQHDRFGYIGDYLSNCLIQFLRDVEAVDC